MQREVVIHSASGATLRVTITKPRTKVASLCKAFAKTLSSKLGRAVEPDAVVLETDGSVLHRDARVDDALPRATSLITALLREKACEVCGARPEKTLKCTRCHSGAFCSTKCFRDAWKTRRHACRGRTVALPPPLPPSDPMVQGFSPEELLVLARGPR